MSVPQAEIFVLGGRDVGRSFLVEGAALLGRADPCDVRLNDRSVSRRHARLYSDRGRWVIEDLGSRNGLRQDGRSKERIVLADGDEFLVGELPLRLRIRRSEPAAPTVPEDPVLEEVPPPAAPEEPLIEEVSTPAPVEDEEDWPSLTGPAPGAPPAPRPTPRPRALEEEEEIELELPEEIELEAPEEPVETPAPGKAYQPRVGAGRREVPGRGKSGALGGDLSQRPLWVQTVVFLGVAILASGLCYGAYLALRMLRGAA